jgi:hypothetical protein
MRQIGDYKHTVYIFRWHTMIFITFKGTHFYFYRIFENRVLHTRFQIKVFIVVTKNKICITRCWFHTKSKTDCAKQKRKKEFF